MDRNIIKWWYVTDRQGDPTGLRGWDDRMENRYELVYQDETDDWQVSVVVKHKLDDGWGFRRIRTSTLFECMVAAEKHAQERYEDSIAEREE